MQTKILGFIITLVGIILLLVQTDLTSIASLITWPFLLFLFSVLLLYVGILKKISALTLWAGFAATISIMVWGLKYVNGWPKHWSILVALFGLVVLLQFTINKSKITALVGVILILTGIFEYPGITELPLVSPITSVFHAYWPVLIVILGLVFISKK
jgi:hypothetical protein